MDQVSTQETFQKVVSLDPGVSPFVAWYAPNAEEAGIIGKRNQARLVRFLLHVDQLQSKASLERRRKNRQRILIAKAKVQAKIKNLVKEIHNKTIRFLLERYDLVVLPWFGSKNMSRKLSRVLPKKATRAMLTWSHGLFRNKLLAKAEITKGKKVIVLPSEAYTSKTCSSCGWEHPSLGGLKRFSCRGCGLKADRDIQGAKNIFLKAIADGFIKIKTEAGLTCQPLPDGALPDMEV